MPQTEEQAGLEVMESAQYQHPMAASPEQMGSQAPAGGYYAVGSYDKIPVNTASEVQIDEKNQGPNPKALKKKRILWISIALIAVVVIVGAVAGGVLGSKAASKKHDGSTKSGADDGKANSTAIKSNSALAVTGWRSKDKTNLQLFWQGKDDFVYYSGWNSGHDNWDAPIRLNVGAAPDTPLAASVVYQTPAQEGGPPDPQVQLYYRNTSDYLNGENFRASFPNGLHDSINESPYSFKMDKDSALAAYWPGILLERSGIQAIWYGPTKDVYGYAQSANSMSKDSVVGGAPMAMLPIQRVSPSRDDMPDSDLKLFYRREDGFLYEFDSFANGTVVKNDKIDGFKITSGAALAAFATARDDSSAAINSYLLYQAEDGKIMYGSNTNSAGWVGPNTDSVFEGADNPTRLACVTMAEGTDGDIPLSSATDMNKCYFQMDGDLVEVFYDGQKWVGRGTIKLSL